MTKTFYRKHNSDWFRDKKAVMLKSTENNAGGKIRKGSYVLISHKFGRGGLCVRSTSGIYIKGIAPEQIDLINQDIVLKERSNW